MQKKRKQPWLRWLKIIIVAYIIIGVVFYFTYQKLLFHPQALPTEHRFSFTQPFKEINLTVDDDKNLNIIQFNLPDSTPKKGLVLYFHGNKENVEHYAGYASLFTRNGYNVWMIDYPGFGKTTGKLTERALYDDAEIIYNMGRSEFNKKEIVIYGKSLGTGVAAWLAAKKDCRRLILETPYYSMDAIIKRFAFIYPVHFLTRFHLPTFEYLKKVYAPVTIFHGTDDSIVPYKNSKRLSKILPRQTELVTLEDGKHNNLTGFPLFNRKLDSVLQVK